MTIKEDYVFNFFKDKEDFQQFMDNCNDLMEKKKFIIKNKKKKLTKKQIKDYWKTIYELNLILEVFLKKCFKYKINNATSYKQLKADSLDLLYEIATDPSPLIWSPP